MKSPGERFTRNVAIVIGIDRYGDGIPRLGNACRDALVIGHALGTQHGFEVRGMFDHRATREAVSTCVRELALDRDARLLFYFAGHGVTSPSLAEPAGYLLLHDAVMGEPATFLPMRALHDHLVALGCRHLLIILDCCFAGAFRWAVFRDVERPTTVVREAYDRFVESAAHQVLTSSASDQRAFEVLAGRGGDLHSPFATAVLEGLAGAADVNQDNLITTTELHVHVRKRVEDQTESLQLQTPGIFPLRGHERGEFVFQVPGRQLKLDDAKPLPIENPYRGLDSFGEDDRAKFWGRTSAIRNLMLHVLKHSFTAVLGPSGCGKSSLVFAGVVARFRTRAAMTGKRRWTVVGGMRAVDAIEQRLDQTVIPEGNVLVVIDQLEELLTQTVAPDARTRLLDKLVAWSSERRVHVVVTVRSDFEPLLRGKLPAPIWDAGRFLVPVMTQPQLREAIERPVAAHEVYFQPASIIDRLAEEVAQRPSALPLLSFALAELYGEFLKRYQADAHNTRRAILERDYDAVGGVAGALTRRAEKELQALQRADPRHERIARNVMTRMVTRERGELARRRVASGELVFPDEADTVRAEALVKQFAAARLITKEAAWVEPAHDALVLGWERVRRWRDELGASAALLHETSIAAASWIAGTRDAARLWDDDGRLDQILKLRDALWNADEAAFIAASRDRRRNRRWAWLAAAILTGVGLLVLVLVFRNLARDEAKARSAAERNLDVSEGGLASAMSARPGQEAEALVRGLRAYVRAESAGNATPLEVRRGLYDALGAMTRSMRIGGSRRAEIHAAIFDPKTAAWIVSADDAGRICFWQAATGRPLGCHTVDDVVTDASLSPDGDSMCVAGHDKADTHSVARLYRIDRSSDVPMLVDERTLLHSPHTERTCVFSRDGRSVAFGGSGGRVTIWQRSAEGSIERHIPNCTPEDQRYSCMISRLDFTPDGAGLVAGTWSGTIWAWATSDDDAIAGSQHVMWQIATGKGRQLRSIWGPPSKLVALEYAPDGDSWLFAIEQLGMLALNASPRPSDADGRTIVTLKDHLAELAGAHWAPDGDHLLSFSWDHTAHLYQRSGEALRMERRLEGHSFFVFDGRFSPDSRRIVTASNDGMRVWDTQRGQASTWAGRRMVIHATPRGLIPAPSGGELMAEPSILPLAPQNHACERRFPGWDPPRDNFYVNSNNCTTTALSPDMRWLAIAGIHGEIWLWDLDAKSGHLVTKLEASGDVHAIAFRDDAKQIALGTNTGQIFLVSTEDSTSHPEASLRNPVDGLVFLPDGVHLMVSLGDARMFRIDVVNHRAELLGEAGRWSLGFVVSPDRRYVATFRNEHPDPTKCKDSEFYCVEDRDQRFYVWPVGMTGGVQESPVHPHTVRAVAFSSDGMIASSLARETSLWKPGHDRKVVIRDYDNVMSALAFSPDGRFLAGGTAARALYVYDTMTQTTRSALGHTASIQKVGFSPDGRYVWSGSSPSEGAIRIWSLADPKTLRLVATFEGLTAGINRVIWRPGAEEVVAVDMVGTIRWYPLASKGIMHLACQLLAYQSEFEQIRELCGNDGVLPAER